LRHPTTSSRCPRAPASLLPTVHTRSRTSPRLVPKPNTAAALGIRSAQRWPKTQSAGKYHVCSDQIENDFDCDDELSLSIQDDPERKNTRPGREALLGEFKFCVLEGVMRFWRDDEEWADFRCEDPEFDFKDEEHDANERRVMYSGARECCLESGRAR
jgi:hypothetical protein